MAAPKSFDLASFGLTVGIWQISLCNSENKEFFPKPPPSKIQRIS